MINTLLFPFRLALKEIKKDNAFRKAIHSKTVRSAMLSFIGQSYIFLIILSVMYAALAYILIVTILSLQPIGLIMIPVFLLMLWLFITIYKHVFPKPKKNFLKYKNVYEQYQEVTKGIE